MFSDSSLSLLHISRPIMGFSGFFITCMSAWQEMPLNSRSVLNLPRTGVASLTPNPDITVFVGRRRALVLGICNLPQTKCLWWRQCQLIH